MSITPLSYNWLQILLKCQDSATHKEKQMSGVAMATRCIKEGPVQSPGISRSWVAGIKCLVMCLGTLTHSG